MIQVYIPLDRSKLVSPLQAFEKLFYSLVTNLCYINQSNYLRYLLNE